MTQSLSGIVQSDRNCVLQVVHEDPIAVNKEQGHGFDGAGRIEGHQQQSADQCALFYYYDFLLFQAPEEHLPGRNQVKGVKQ